MPVQIIRGLRQCGKSSLLAQLGGSDRRHVTLDDLRLRQAANADPALFFSQNPPPVTIDEIQHAPVLFQEIKLRVDAARAKRRGQEPNRSDRSAAVDSPFWLTGSNQILLEKFVQESLAGRAGYHILHTLSVAELCRSLPNFSLPEAFFRGGWPELYVTPTLEPVRYLNDYILTYLEKDIVQSAGIQKSQSFEKALGLLAARTACLFNASEIAAACGVKSVTIQEWTSVLERNLVMFFLHGYHTNLNKRLIKAPKVYFLDVGLASRLQGWSAIQPLLNSPQAGFLFETLVLAEIVKTKDHFARQWSLYYWRSKEGEEMDFLVFDRHNKCLVLEAKMAIQSVVPVSMPKGRGFPESGEVVLVTFGGEKQRLTPTCLQIPLQNLADHLLENLS
jgi:predicted AAA+ superfamily ATPase